MLRQGSTLFVCLLAGGWAGSDVSESPTVLFTATLHGVQQTTATRTRSATDDFGCTTTTAALDRQRRMFASTRTLTISVARGRFGPVVVPVAARVSGSTQRRFTVAGPPDCDPAPSNFTRACGPHHVAGHALLRSPGDGSLTLRGTYADRAGRGRCASTLAPPAPFLVEAEGDFRPSVLSDPRAKRVTLTGRTKLTSKLVSGTRQTTVLEWTLVLTRIA